MPTNKNPPAKAEGGDVFWDKPTETPVADPNVPIAGSASVAPLVRVEGAPPLPDPAGASIPDVIVAPAAAIDDGKKTPEEWARELGHVDGAAAVSTDPAAKLVGGKIRPIREAHAWKYAAAKRHAGWGTRHPADVRLTRDEYEAVVAEALGRTVGKGTEPTAVAYRHDVVTAANEAAAKAAEEAAKQAEEAGGKV